MLIARVIVLVMAALQDKSAPDHSGEAILKEIFEVGGATRDVHLSSDYYYFEPIPQRYNESNSTDLWLGRGKRFRLVTSSNYWGGGSISVSDGYAWLSDDMSDDGTIRIKDAPKTLFAVDENEPWLYIFEGSAGYAAFVDKEKAISLVKGKAGDAVDFTSKKLGRIVLHYELGAGRPFPTMYELHKAPWWADDPGDGAVAFTKAKLRVVSEPTISLNLFSVKPPVGRKVVDERSVKSGS